MRIRIEQLNKYISTLNFILCFVGYQLTTTLFLPISSNIENISRNVTLPYRAFALGISIMVILLNFKKPSPHYPLALKVFLFFWAALIIRIFYDVFINSDTHLKDTSQLWLYIFGICLPSVFSIIKSYKFIDLEKTFWWISIIITFALTKNLFTNQGFQVSADRLEGRQMGNLALDSISFGHLGTTGILLILFALIKKKLSFSLKFFLILSLFLSLFSMLRAGSRGPIISLMIVILFWLFAQEKNIIKGLFILIFACVIIVIFFKNIFTLIGTISPILEQRLRLFIFEGNTSIRDVFYLKAFNAFLESPIFGKQFALFDFDNYGDFIYSHNILLDAFMGLGIIGGAMMIYFLLVAVKKTYLLIKKNNNHFWISLILMQQIVSSMISGGFYYDQLLSVLLTFTFLYNTKTKNKEPYQQITKNLKTS